MQREGTATRNSKVLRASGAAGIFLGIVAAEACFLAALPFWDRITQDAVNTFLMVSMASGFIPLILVAAVLLAVGGSLLGLAFVAARWFWRQGQPDAAAQERGESLAKAMDDRPEIDSHPHA